ncbi:MAG: GTPase ObgE [Fimbriimonadaceae bacterium]|nr:GTPase ObgE [Fimbriimonadaceae bacterium]
MFIDHAKVEFISGRGGSGAVSFHREKHVPRGGPNGADGGRGGSIILVADRGRRTLYDLQLAQRVSAESGEHGVGNKRGRDAKDVEVKVPVGTIVTDEETEDVLVDMATHGMRYVLCKGGKGGKGNQHYTNSVRQAPNFAQKGAPQERVLAKLELKLLADVALVGLPNAGKSTLISRLSAARPKVADYPFTTIIPNLGVVKFRDETFVVADMPGLISGASQGVGLGHQFLKHVERCRILVHVVDVYPMDESDPMANYHLVENELRLYREDIWSRPRIIALNKLDILPPGGLNAMREPFESLGHPVIAISGATGDGVERLMDLMLETLKAAEPIDSIPVVTPELATRSDLEWSAFATDEGFEVTGKRVLRMVEMTQLDNEEALRYLHRRLERIGVIERLRELGAEEGDDVTIGDFVFSYSDEL